ncbi:formyltransferase family protein [Methylomonas sp. Kb3]|uniref:formyltransferase family protein n=1 Tax=Methylomonas sp. Kb3 TaxID=1611544 RepID=UPI0013FDA0F2|nr:formyltransferase family protein [Methylomonas sp. Kb3]
MAIKLTKNIVCFSSHGPGNFETVLDYCALSSGRARVISLITDRERIPSIDMARTHGIPYRVFSFSTNKISDPNFNSERARSSNEILSYLLEIEKNESIDLIVCAFRRILVGNIIHHFARRIINVHPADLSVWDFNTRTRRYLGIGGLKKSILDGNKTTRTTIHYLDEGVDTGEIICLGPPIPVEHNGNPFNFEKHESAQKLKSDKPALMFALDHVLFPKGSFDQPIILSQDTTFINRR